MKTRITWNKATRTYTVSTPETVVRGIEAKSQADCVAMELRHGWAVSFGTLATTEKTK